MAEIQGRKPNRRAGVDTLMNLLRILFLLRTVSFREVEGWPGSSYPALTAAQISERMDAGVALKTVKGWLAKLQDAGFVESLPCPGRETHWMLDKDSPLHDFKLAEVDAVNKLIAHSDVLATVPADMRVELQALKRKMEDRLRNMVSFGTSGTRMPLERLTILQRGAIESPPRANDDVMSAVYEALWHKRRLQLTYHSSQRQQRNERAEVFETSPIRLVQHRDGRLYLLVPSADMPTPDPGPTLPFKTLAMHRILAATCLDKKADYDPSIDKAAVEMDGFGYRGHILLVANIAQRFAFRLEESPVNNTQQLSPSGSTDLPIRLEVEVPWTWDLEWWLRSTGADVEILEPPELRSEMAQNLQKAASRYN